jgi:glycosyltransferase involved in cell wall biosynthesis
MTTGQGLPGSRKLAMTETNSHSKLRIGYLMQNGVPDVRTPPFSGPAIHVRCVCEELIKLGHQIRVIAFIDDKIWKSEDLRTFEKVPDPIMDLGPLRFFEKAIHYIQNKLQLPYFNFFNSIRFGLACNRELKGFDLLYERMGWFGFGGAFSSYLLKLPRILELNGDQISEMEKLGIAPKGMQKWVSFKIAGIDVNQAASYVAAGEGWRKQFISRWHVSPGAVVTVQNGSEIINLLKRDQLKNFQEADSPVEKISLVFLGSLEPWQGIDILLEAFAEAVVDDPRLELAIIGYGSRYKEISQLVSEKKLDNKVIFTGQIPIEEVAKHLSRADIGCAPYTRENEFSGLKLFDYKSSGLAIICSGRDGQPDVLIHGQTGWIIPPGDVEALKTTILSFCADPELRRRLGQSARFDAEENNSWKNTAQQLVNNFQSTLGK